MGIYLTTYEAENTIPYLLKSLKDVLKDHEIFISVVDNCSTDNTVSVLKRLCNKYKFKSIIEKQKTTRGKGRQIALENLLKAYGDKIDLIFYVDADWKLLLHNWREDYNFF